MLEAGQGVEEQQGLVRGPPTAAGELSDAVEPGEPGFLRLGAALARVYANAPAPIYRFMFSDGFAFGFPPEEYGLEAYLKLLEEGAPGAHWMIAGLAVHIRPLIAAAVAQAATSGSASRMPRSAPMSRTSCGSSRRPRRSRAPVPASPRQPKCGATLR